MTATPRTNPNASNDTAANKDSQARHKIDRTAPAGSENSLGAQSVRDGRPSTCDDVVEAKDEATPGAN
ncbi:MAG: hypothetical protein ACYCO5_04590 [Acidobacteriaceae bacterium]